MRRLLLLFLLPICLWSWADDDIFSSTYKVAKVRYWYDRTGEPQQMTYSGKQITFDASKLIDGFHTFYYQLITTEGDVSPTYSRTFIKISDAESISSISDSYVVSKVRYWFDRGGDLHTSDYTGNSFTLDASSLDDGIHTLYYQLLTKDGHTSSVSSRTFIKVSDAESLSSISDKYVVTGVRYWFDRTGVIQTGTYSSNSFTLDASSLDDGVHTLYYQLLTKDGHTSSVSSRTFIKVSDAVSNSAFSSSYVVKSVRYWFDRKGVVNTGSYNGKSFTLDASKLEDGMHTLYYQLVTDEGHVSSTHVRIFIKVSEDGSISTIEGKYVPKTVRYWVDNDTTNIQTTDYSSGILSHDMASLEEGAHWLYYQIVTEDGHTSPVHRQMFERSFFDITIGKTQTLKEGNYSEELLARKPWLALNYRLSDASVLGHLTVEEGDSLTLGKFAQRLHYGCNTGQDKFTNAGEEYYHLSTLVNDGKVTSDSVYIEASFYKNRWHFITVPFNVNISDIQTEEGVLWVVRTYDGSERAAGHFSNTWKNLTMDDVLEAGKGYILQATSNDDKSSCRFTFPAAKNMGNGMFSSENRIVPIEQFKSEFAHNRSWNLVGNPYPSFFNSKQIDLSVPITVWNGNGYTAYSLEDDDYVLMPYESFFIQCPLNSNELTFSPLGRRHTNESQMEMSSKAKMYGKNTSRHVHNFLLSDGAYTDKCRIVINEGASDAYEMDKDASKFISANEGLPQIFTVVSGVTYAINELPLGDGVVPLTICAGNNTTLTLHYEPGTNAYDDVLLIDRESGETVNLCEKDAKLSIEEGAVLSCRYYISFVDEPTAMEKIETTSATQQKPMHIYDIQGRPVDSKRRNGIYIQNGIKYFENKP